MLHIVIIIGRRILGAVGAGFRARLLRLSLALVLDHSWLADQLRVVIRRRCKVRYYVRERRKVCG